MVLLKNADAFLPLNKKKLKSIAVIGPHADRCYFGPGYVGRASKAVTPLEGIRVAVGAGIEVRHAKGCEILNQKGAERSIAEAANMAKACDVAIVIAGTDQ